MKANLPRSWHRLPPSERQRILDAADEQMNRNVNIILDIYLKMSCQVLHEAFGFGEKRLNMYLGNYRRIFRENRRNVRDGVQIYELDRKMRKIFRKSGYPDHFFKAMIEGWETETNKEGPDDK